jgi:hypothetical protein
MSHCSFRFLFSQSITPRFLYSILHNFSSGMGLLHNQYGFTVLETYDFLQSSVDL